MMSDYGVWSDMYVIGVYDQRSYGVIVIGVYDQTSYGVLDVLCDGWSNIFDWGKYKDWG